MAKKDLSEQNKLTKMTFEAIEAFSKTVQEVEAFALKETKKAKSIADIDSILTEYKIRMQDLTGKHHKKLKDINNALSKYIKD